MRNDFFKHILLSGGSKQNRTELETETLPYTFTSNSYRLRNYKIYGNTVNGESVGNLVTEGEHAGEYCVPVTVTVEGKNILPMSTTPISRDIDDFHCEYDGVGTITLTTDKDNAQLSKFYIPLSQDFVIPISVGQGGGGCLQFNNSIASPNTYNDYIAVEFYNDNTVIDTWRLTTINRIHSSYTLLGGKTINCIALIVSGTGFGTNRKLVIKPAIVLNTTEQVPFEPYHAPITTNLYLPEQIKIVGDEAEYVDYKEQKQHRVRKNLWNEETATNTYLSTDGSLVASDKNNMTSDFIHVKANAVYTYSYNPVTPSEESGLWTGYMFYREADERTALGGRVTNTSDTTINITVPSNVEYIRIGSSWLQNGGTAQFEFGTATPYEPYIKNTEIPVSLPAIPTVDGTNIITVDTETQPSKIYIQGNISEIETVSAETQALQTNMQSLQPLSLDENSIEEILETENLETTGDDENAE